VLTNLEAFWLIENLPTLRTVVTGIHRNGSHFSWDNDVGFIRLINIYIDAAWSSNSSDTAWHGALL
jgi:hypothetical protein